MQQHLQHTFTQYTPNSPTYPDLFPTKILFSIFTPIHPNFNFKHSKHSPTFNTRNTVTINSDPPTYSRYSRPEFFFNFHVRSLFLFPPFLFFPPVSAGISHRIVSPPSEFLDFYAGRFVRLHRNFSATPISTDPELRLPSTKMLSSPLPSFPCLDFY